MNISDDFFQKSIILRAAVLVVAATITLVLIFFIVNHCLVRINAIFNQSIYDAEGWMLSLRT